jgi:hypothetical protein
VARGPGSMLPSKRTGLRGPAAGRILPRAMARESRPLRPLPAAPGAWVL